MRIRNLISVIVSCLLMVGCFTGEHIIVDDTTKIHLELTLQSSSQHVTKGLSVDQEDLIKDMQILIFDSDDRLIAGPVPTGLLTFTEPGDISRVTIALDKESYLNRDVTFVLLGNVDDNVSLPTLTVGTTTRSDVLNSLVYSISDEWPTDGSRPFPMFGSTSVSLNESYIYKTVWMLRALARVQFTVNDGLGLGSLLDLTSINVYYSRTEGYFCPSTDFDNNSPSTYTIHTENSFGQRIVSSPLEYSVPEAEKWAYKRSIYIPENRNVSPNPEAVVLVVGAKYDGSVTPTYYKVKFSDGLGDYDILRNWSYDFNITGASSPGKATPEEALQDGAVLEIEIKNWNEIAIAEARVNSQYELDVTKSMFALDNLNQDIIIGVGTTYDGGWYYDTDSKSPSESWYTVVPSGEGSDNGQITLHVSQNATGISRTGSFTIHAGSIVKKIYITQLQLKTSNCYLVSEPGLHGLYATVMGNGGYGSEFTYDIYNNKGVKTGTETVNIASYMANAAPAVYYSDGTINEAAIKSARIIWQTRPGLITSVGGTGGDPLLEPETGILKYEVGDPLPGEKGGNALIGIFDEDGNVIWSWHIWVIWGYDEAASDLHFLTSGVRSGYFVMDRNLGALDKERGSADAFGLLYQWGRKDPMRGTSKVDLPYEFTKTYSYTGTDLDYSAENGAEWHAWSGGTAFMDILTSVRNPMNLSLSWGQGANSNSAALWGNPSGGTSIGGTASSIKNSTTAPADGTLIWPEGKKSIYDPCPLGYKVPSVNGFYFGVSAFNNNVVHSNFDFTTGIAGAEVYPYSYCDIDQLGYSIYYFGQYKNYEKYYTWMPMTPFYEGSYSALTHPLAGGEGFAYTWLNASPSTATSTNGLEIPWHPINHHIHQYGTHSVERYNGGTVRCVRETDPDLISATVPEKVVLLADTGSSMDFEVLTNSGWRVEVNNLTYSWVSATRGMGSDVNVVATFPNMTGKPREALVYVVLDNGEKFPVRVIQESVNVGTGVMRVGNASGASVSTSFTVPAGGTVSLPATGDDKFTYVLTNTGQNYTITVTSKQTNASPYEWDRDFDLNLSDGIDTYPMSVKAVQDAYSISSDPVPVAYAAGSKGTATFTPPGGAVPSLKFTDDGWFTYALSVNRGVYTLTATAKGINYGKDHTETPVVIIGGYEYSLYVTQLSAASAITLQLGKGNLGNRASQSTTLKSTNSANYDWTVKTLPSWLNISSTSGTGIVNVTVTTNEANTSGVDREGEIELEFSYGGVPVRVVEITIKQNK